MKLSLSATFMDVSMSSVCFSTSYLPTMASKVIQRGIRLLTILCDFTNNCVILHRRILKICVGDLVNKGPKSKEVIEYFMSHKDSCLSVRGNHDEVIISAYIKLLESGEVLEKNSWIKELTTDHMDLLTQLPYTITIPK